MRQNSQTTVNEFKKLHIKETVLFAIKYIPQLDQTTLEKFLELVNTTGTFGAVSRGELLHKMRLTLKYIPNACPHTLIVLAELLEVPMDEKWPNATASIEAPVQARLSPLAQEAREVKASVGL